MVIVAGSERVGAVVSRTVTVNEPWAVLLCASVALHCTVVVAMANVDPEAGLQVTLTAPSTRSVDDALKVTAAPDALVASAVMFAGSESVGAVVSRTVTVNEPLAVLLCASVALHCTVVVPIAKVEPERGLQVTGTGPSTSSLADAEYVTVAPAAEVASAVMFAGSVRTGGVLSAETVTLNDPKPKF